MRAFSSIWLVLAAVCGASYGARGHNPESLRGLIVLSGAVVAFVVAVVLLTPVLVRVDGGRRNWRTEAAQVATGGVVLAALMLVGAGVYRLAAGATGGWQGGWGGAAIGAASGVAVGLAVRSAVRRIRLFERLGLTSPDAELGAAADGGA
jgi:hypothetical protein